MQHNVGLVTPQTVWTERQVLQSRVQLSSVKWPKTHQKDREEVRYAKARIEATEFRASAKRPGFHEWYQGPGQWGQGSASQRRSLQEIGHTKQVTGVLFLDFNL